MKALKIKRNQIFVLVILSLLPRHTDARGGGRGGRGGMYSGGAVVDDSSSLHNNGLTAGAATSSGLKSSIPFDVAPGKPLIYCGTSKYIQSQIRINNEDIYFCNKKRIETSCLNQAHHECSDERMQCDLDDGILDNMYCQDDTLFSKALISCNSTTVAYKKSEKLTILNCYEVLVQNSQSISTKKPLSFRANVHIFLLNLIGQSEILNATTSKYNLLV
ncbi:hypothetical protein ACKWTF_001158 [Chironomus riparius]